MMKDNTTLPLPERMPAGFYVVDFEYDTDGFFVKVPDLPGCMSQGATFEEACYMTLMPLSLDKFSLLLDEYHRASYNLGWDEGANSGDPTDAGAPYEARAEMARAQLMRAYQVAISSPTRE